MDTVNEVVKAYWTYDVGMVEAKLKANRVLNRLHFQIYSQNAYPVDYSDTVWQNALFELGYLYGRTYIGVPDVYKRAFKGG